jgi:hypothetical protein
MTDGRRREDDPLIVQQSGDPNGVEEYWSDHHAKEESLAITERVVPGLEMLHDGCGRFQGRVCATRESRTLNKLLPLIHWSVSTPSSTMVLVILFRGIALCRVPPRVSQRTC